MIIIDNLQSHDNVPMKFAFATRQDTQDVLLISQGLPFFIGKNDLEGPTQPQSFSC